MTDSNYTLLAELVENEMHFQLREMKKENKKFIKDYGQNDESQDIVETIQDYFDLKDNIQTIIEKECEEIIKEGTYKLKFNYEYFDITAYINLNIERIKGDYLMPDEIYKDVIINDYKIILYKYTAQ